MNTKHVTLVALCLFCMMKADAQSTWNLAGNASTNPSSDFLGTTDGQPLVFRTNNTEQMRLTAGGYLGIGVTPQATLDVPNLVRVGGTSSPALPSTGKSIELLYDLTANKGIIRSYDRSGSAYVPLTLMGNMIFLTSSGNYLELDDLSFWNSYSGYQALIPGNLIGTKSNTDLTLFADGTAGVAGKGVGIAYHNFSNGDWYSALRIENTTSGYGLLKLMEAGGQVAINGGCAKAGYALAVKGKIICEEVKVKLEGGNCWADYVFDKKYTLMPLTDLAGFIEMNKHLPDIPAAAEVEKDGISLNEMIVKQMVKIEELTLYLLEMQKQNEALQQRVRALEVRN